MYVWNNLWYDRLSNCVWEHTKAVSLLCDSRRWMKAFACLWFDWQVYCGGAGVDVLYSKKMKDDDNMFTRIIVISYVEHNVAICFLKDCPLILASFCPLFLEGTWISHQNTSDSPRMEFCMRYSSQAFFGWKLYYRRKGLACDVSPRLTRAIMVGETSLVRVCACLIYCQRTSELMSIIFAFRVSYPII